MTMKKARAYQTESDKIDPERYHNMVESYSFEDYTKDFEFDHLGWDGIPEDSALDVNTETPAGDGVKPEAG